MPAQSFCGLCHNATVMPSWIDPVRVRRREQARQAKARKVERQAQERQRGGPR